MHKLFLPPAVVFDLDGTLVNGLHRVHHIQRKEGDLRPKDWDSYWAELEHDTLIKPVADICHIIASRCATFYATARPAEVIERTQRWIRKMNLPDIPLYHRNPGDRRDDDIIKPELLKEIEAEGYQILMVFEDRNRVVTALRAAGYIVAQTIEGDY